MGPAPFPRPPPRAPRALTKRARRALRWCCRRCVRCGPRCARAAPSWRCGSGGRRTCCRRWGVGLHHVGGQGRSDSGGQQHRGPSSSRSSSSSTPRSAGQPSVHGSCCHCGRGTGSEALHATIPTPCPPTRARSQLAAATGAARVVCHAEVTAEERGAEAAAAAALRRSGVRLKVRQRELPPLGFSPPLVSQRRCALAGGHGHGHTPALPAAAPQVLWGGTLLHQDDLPFPLDAAPLTFAAFRAAVTGRQAADDGAGCSTSGPVGGGGGVGKLASAATRTGERQHSGSTSRSGAAAAATPVRAPLEAPSSLQGLPDDWWVERSAAWRQATPPVCLQAILRGAHAAVGRVRMERQPKG